MADNGCAGNTSACDLRDLQAVKLPFRRELAVWCAGCRTKAAAMGLQVIERRLAAVPVERERRSFVPRWLARGSVKDLTGATR